MRAALLIVSAVLLSAPAAAADSFAIIHEDSTETSRVVSLRIEGRLAESALARIATGLKNADSNPKLRHMVVSFFLPGMPSNQRPWASVDTTPATKVTIAGLRLEEAAALSAQIAADKRPFIGAWLTDLPGTPGRISIFSAKGKLYLEQVPRSGQVSQLEVQASKVAEGTRFDPADGGDEHFVLKPDGSLEQRSGEQLIATAERVRLKGSSPLVAALANAQMTAVERGVSDAEVGAGPQAAPGAEANPVTKNESSVERAAKPLRMKQRPRRVARAKRPSAVFIVDYMRPQIAN